MNSITTDQPIGQIIRSARQQLRMSQYDLADKLAAVSGKPTMGRDRVARWERGRQVPRTEWRQWLSVVLRVPTEQLDAGAMAARRQNRLGHAAVTSNAPHRPGAARRPQGTPALLPVFRSRVQAGILAATLLNPGRAFSLTELADHAGGSLASVSKESQLLEEAGILTTRNEGAIRLIRAVTDRPMLGPLTELIRVTYGVPQVIGEEFGAVPGVERIALTGTWAERFAGVVGPEPERIQLRLTIAKDMLPDDEALTDAAQRAQRRLNRAVVFSTVPSPPAAPVHGRSVIPRQRDRRPIVHVAPQPSTIGQQRATGSWPNGAETMAKLLNNGQLELFSGTGADSAPYFALAEHHLSAAEAIMAATPGSAFVLVCQASALIGTGLLAQQGLRPAAGCNGDVVGQAVAAQFGPQFGQIALLRQRFLGLSSPVGRDNLVTAADAEASVPALHALLETARDTARELNLFT